MKWSNPGRQRDSLFIKNIDTVYDYFLNLSKVPISEKLFDDCKVPGNCRDLNYFNWLANRMRYAWHPQAKSYVYAYTYHEKNDIENESEGPNRIVEYMSKNSIGRKNDWIESSNLVKIGTSIAPEDRRRSHLSELYGEHPDLRDAFRFNCRLLILPCFRANAGGYLEALVLNSMPPEDHFYGEWYHDTFGVFKVLASWFASCRACDEGKRHDILG